MKYLSVCSGIEAAGAAWAPLGWECLAVSEIADFPSKVIAAHFPQVPNLGDIRSINGKDWKHAELLVGGTPCQDFSVANTVRTGLAGERSSLARHFVRLLHEINPVWFLWENVPGAFTTNGGRDFEELLQKMVRGGIALHGECLTLSTLESPRDAVASSLWDILETGEHLHRYFLSPKACAGILKRAERRGLKIPGPLRHALKATCLSQER